MLCKSSASENFDGKICRFRDSVSRSTENRLSMVPCLHAHLCPHIHHPTSFVQLIIMEISCFGVKEEEQGFKLRL